MKPPTKVRACAALVATAFIGACNVFNPSGEADPTTAQEWIDQGEAQLRDLDFAGAEASFGHVLSEDSGSAAAWNGYVKAVSGRTLDLGLLLREALEAEREHRKPLWDVSLVRKDSIYATILPTWRAFEAWARLASEGRTVLPATRRTERGLVLLAHSMLALWDSDRDGRITASGDVLSIRLFSTLSSKDSSGLGFKPLVDAALFGRTLADGSQDPSGATDSVRIADFDTLLRTVDREFAIIDTISREDTTLTAITSSIASQNPGAIGFFAVSNRLDDDMDGCADEEILDGLDNDGDILVDEDSRAGYVVPGAGQGDLAQACASDSIRGDRLADPSTGRGLPGADSLGTLRYGDSRGHIEVFRPSWDITHGRYPQLRWKYTCDWGSDVAAELGTSCQSGALMDPATRVAIARYLSATRGGRTRAEVGCSLLGGCWCRVLAEVCEAAEGCDAR